MFDSAGNPVERAIPSMPVSVLGLDAPPAPGVFFEIVANDKIARSLAEDRRQQERTRQVSWTRSSRA